ncbi:Hypothetical protein BN69_1819 [Methylocystis sp. SC2]|nr:Hypothetical protein BN69_1819 [Methylocystis sp. SC2]
MAERKLVFRPHVQHRVRPVADSLEQLVARYGLQPFSVIEIAAHDAFDFRDFAFRQPTERRQKIERGFIGKPIVDEFAVASRAHQAGAAHVLEMLRGVGDGEAGCHFLFGPPARTIGNTSLFESGRRMNPWEV